MPIIVAPPWCGLEAGTGLLLDQTAITVSGPYGIVAWGGMTIATGATTTISTIPFRYLTTTTGQTVYVQQANPYSALGLMSPVEQQQVEQLERVTAPGIIHFEPPPARVRARRLLESFLDSKQMAQLRRERSFIVIGRSGRRYRLKWGRVGNIELLHAESGVWLERYCVHPTDDREHLPTEDVLLGQMLALAHDDDAVLRIANRHAVNSEVMNRQARQQMAGVA